MIISYDVSTSDIEGKKRLRKVAKECQNHAQRVQNSVFEVLVDATQLTALKHELSKEINEDVDSIRFYRLGNSYHNKIDSMGKKLKVEAGEPLLF